MKFKFLFLFFLSTQLVSSQILFTHNWSKGMGSSIGYEESYSTVLDASGDMYVAGKIGGVVDFDPGPGVATQTGSGNAFIAKYNSSGAFVWANVIEGPGISSASYIGIDGAGDIYVTGWFQGGTVDFDPVGTATVTAAQNDMFFAKYTNNGAYVWHKTIGSLSNNVDPQKMTVTSSGDLFITGSFIASTDFDAGPAVATLTCSGFQDAFLIKYNSSGNYLWSLRIGDGGYSAGYGLDVDPAGDIYITGQFENAPDFDPGAGTASLTTNGLTDCFAAKYTSAGNYVWAAKIGGAGSDYGVRCKYINTELVISGAMQSATVDADPGAATYTLNKVGVSPNDVFLVKLSSCCGVFSWGKNTGSTAALGDITIYDLKSDVQNNIYICGSFTGPTDFDMGVGTFTVPNLSAGSDMFIAKYNDNSNFLYVKNMGGGSNDGNAGCAMEILNSDIYFTGNYADVVDMDPSALTSTLSFFGLKDFYIAKYTQCYLPVIPSVTVALTNLCANLTNTLSVTSGSLGDATAWNWYSGSCGGTLVGSGTTLTLTALASNTYFVKGEGGCVPNGGACNSLAVTVNSLTNISGQVTTNTVTPVSGSVTLYRYETQFTKFDSITTVPLDAMGNYTILSAPSASCILKAIPTATNQIITYAPSAISWKSAGVFTHSCAIASSQNINVIPLANFGAGPGMLTGKIVQGAKYGQKGAQVLVPGNPIKGISVKGGRNPGGNIGATDMTSPTGGYTLGGLAVNGVGESYFVLVDVPGLDTNNTYHKVIAAGTETYTQLDFVIDSAKIHPMIFVGVKEEKFENNTLKIFPNPTNGKLFIECELAKPCDVKIEIMDMLGRTVETILPMSFQDTKQLTIISDIKKLQHGIYFINIEAGGSKKTTKILLTE